MTRSNTQKGFTLIEMIIVILIVGILAAFSSIALLQGSSAYFKGQDIKR